MRILIIGAVAAGTSVAAKARRNDETAEIVLYEKDSQISYAVCGIPYSISGEVKTFEELTPRDAPFFKEKYNVDIFTEHLVERVFYEKKMVIVRNLKTNELFEDSFDKLVFATGTTPTRLEVFDRDFENLFSIKNPQSGVRLKRYIEANQSKSALIIGAGYVGLETAEQLKLLGLDVTVLTHGSQAMSGFDEEIAKRIETEMKKQDVHFIKNSTITKANGAERISAVTLNDNSTHSFDVYLSSVGITPNVSLATEIGVELGKTGVIKVNDRMETNLKDVYAVGDVAEKYSKLTQDACWVPLATHANKEGRILGDVLTGGNSRNHGILGTSILRFYDCSIGKSGLTQKEAEKKGFDIEILYNQKNDRPNYIASDSLFMKVIADRETHKIIGAQIVGTRGVDKRLDVLATAMNFGAKAEDLFELDLAYTPIYSTTKDPVNYVGMALTNALEKNKMISIEEMEKLKLMGNVQVIDVRTPQEFKRSHIEGAENIPLIEIRQHLSTLDPNKTTIVYCNTGVSANAAQNILLNEHFKDVRNLNGGNQFYQRQKN